MRSIDANDPKTSCIVLVKEGSGWEGWTEEVVIGWLLCCEGGEEESEE